MMVQRWQRNRWFSKRRKIIQVIAVIGCLFLLLQVFLTIFILDSTKHYPINEEIETILYPDYYSDQVWIDALKQYVYNNYFHKSMIA